MPRPRATNPRILFIRHPEAPSSVTPGAEGSAPRTRCYLAQILHPTIGAKYGGVQDDKKIRKKRSACFQPAIFAIMSFNMKTLSLRNKITIIAAIVAVAAVGYAYFSGTISKDKPKIAETIDRDLPPELEEKYNKDIVELQAKLEADPSDLNSMLLLGNAYYGLGELKQAEEWYRKILAVSPNDTPSLENLGQTLSEAGDYIGARDMWIKALELGGQEVYLYNLIDLIKDKIPQDRDKIKPVLDIALKNLGQTAQLMVMFGEWYYDQGDYEKAISHYEVALTLSPNDENIKQRISQIRLEWAEKQGLNQ
ncbi:TPA: hypothetical protein DCZ32_01295 [Candidatus Uhrbacteria bacterium]|nr:hypothetical protein [Candidatus Uhrbacteria bacterium]